MDDGNDDYPFDGSIVKHLSADGSYTFLDISDRDVQTVSQIRLHFVVSIWCDFNRYGSHICRGRTKLIDFIRFWCYEIER